jgi:hypothetical protein
MGGLIKAAPFGCGYLPCIDEIRKVLPRQKRIDLYLGDQIEIEWVFVRGYDLYDLIHS